MIAWTIAGALAVGSIGGGWYVNDYIHENLATKAEIRAAREEITVAGTKADFALDKQMEDLLAKINRLSGKPNKTAEDLEHLKYLREELQRIREMRRGK